MLANRIARQQPTERTRTRPVHVSRSASALGRLSALGLPHAVSATFVVVMGTALWKSGINQANIFSTVPFILAVLVTAYAWGQGPAVIAALVSAATFNYYWIGQPYRFELPTAQEWLLFSALLMVAVGLGTVTDRMRVTWREADDLAASARLLKTLLSSVSHDLRTPLTAITGSLSTLLADDGRLEAEARRELLSIAYDRAQTLNWLVAQILDMTRLEAGVIGLQLEPGSPQDLLRLALGPMGDAVGRRCRVMVAPGVPLVPMDSMLLSQAVRNVLDNAARHSPPGSAIDVEAARTRNGMVLSISDRGLGVPAGDLTRIFEKFYQVPREMTGRSAGGLGLGLAIAKGIVEAHGGRIWAEQRDGGGTVVRLMLPLG